MSITWENITSCNKLFSIFNYSLCIKEHINILEYLKRTHQASSILLLNYAAHISTSLGFIGTVIVTIPLVMPISNLISYKE